MASIPRRIGLMLFGLVMLLVGGMIALLVIIWELITHPFTFFKKIPRNGELLSHSDIVWLVSQARLTHPPACRSFCAYILRTKRCGVWGSCLRDLSTCDTPKTIAYTCSSLWHAQNGSMCTYVCTPALLFDDRTIRNLPVTAVLSPRLSLNQ